MAVAAEGQILLGRFPKKYKFADVLGYAGLHLPWRCGALGDKAPEEWAKIIEDNKLCPFCLLHDRSEVCYSKVHKKKPGCMGAECKGQHIQWLHELLKGTAQARTKDDGKVNMVQGRGGWRTPEDTWMEEEEEEEVHFVNVVQAVGIDSYEELAAEIMRTEEAIDECYKRSARRAGIAMEGLECRPLEEEESDKLSERVGDGEGVHAKRRKEIGDAAGDHGGRG